MNARDKNKTEMLGKVVRFNEEQKNEFAGIPALGNVAGELKMYSSEIELNMKIISEGTKGKVVSKDVSKDELIDASLKCTGAIFAYAVDAKNAELKVFSDVYSKTFLRKRDSELPGFSELFFDKADELGDKLIPYGFDQAKRADVKIILNDYREKYGAVGKGKGAKKTAFATITMLLPKADERITVEERLLLQLKDDKPELYSLFVIAKTIEKKPGRHDSKKGAKKASANGNKTTSADGTKPAQ